MLCDTNGGTLPSQLRRIVGDVFDQLDCRLGIHTHNDSGCATANSLAAVEAGADVYVQKPISYDVVEGQAMVADRFARSVHEPRLHAVYEETAAT